MLLAMKAKQALWFNGERTVFRKWSVKDELAHIPIRRPKNRRELSMVRPARGYNRPLQRERIRIESPPRSKESLCSKRDTNEPRCRSALLDPAHIGSGWDLSSGFLPLSWPLFLLHCRDAALCQPSSESNSSSPSSHFRRTLDNQMLGWAQSSRRCSERRCYQMFARRFCTGGNKLNVPNVRQPSIRDPEPSG